MFTNIVKKGGAILLPIIISVIAVICLALVVCTSNAGSRSAESALLADANGAQALVMDRLAEKGDETVEKDDEDEDSAEVAESAIVGLKPEADRTDVGKTDDQSHNNVTQLEQDSRGGGLTSAGGLEVSEDGGYDESETDESFDADVESPSGGSAAIGGGELIPDSF